MAALGDLVIICVVGFVIVAALSLVVAKTPATPPFARRVPTSGNPQLRQDSNAGFLQDRGFLFRKRVWFVGTCCPPVRIDGPRYGQLAVAHRQQPVSVAQSGPRVWWWFEDSFYWESGSYSPRDVLALIRDRERRATQRLDRAHMLLNVDEGREQRPQGQRQPIPREVRRAVYERDGGQCAECGSKFDLQYDHLLPVALGGATTVDNLQLLCGECNRMKGADL
ncbi:MAG TPA: HNH endonuclease signature motif containing protein [Streptosporangiaceae bacterium]